MSLLTLYHGSERIISSPDLAAACPFNDFGAGFYLTESREAAAQWACTAGGSGFVNKYRLETDGLEILDLGGSEYNILNWLCVVVQARKFAVASPALARSLAYLNDNFAVDTSGFDIIKGNRADEIYFFFVKAFLNNRISLRQFKILMNLGPVGEQIVLKSEKAFGLLSFDSLGGADSAFACPKKKSRNEDALANYYAEVDLGDEDGIYMDKILRKELKADDIR